MAPSSSSKLEKPLRQLATEKIHGKGTDPSQLGDPVSLKTEETANKSSTSSSRSNTSEAIKSVQNLAPTEGDQDGQGSASNKTETPNSFGDEDHGKKAKADSLKSVQDLAPTEGDQPSQGSTSGTSEAPSSSGGEGYGKTMKDGRTLKGMMKDKIEQAEKGEGNPTMLGDPTSLKAETSKGEDPVDHDNGPSGSQGSSQKRSSKL